MSTSGLQVEVFQPQTPYLASPLVTLLPSPTCPQPSSLLSFLQRVEWLISQQFGRPSLTPWDWPQDCGF